MLESGPCLLLVYVDDFLCIAQTEEDIDRVFGLIETMVELRRTGLIRSSRFGGGSTQQATPTNHTEQGLRALLSFYLSPGTTKTLSPMGRAE